MAPGPSTDPLAEEHATALLRLAARSIRHGLAHGAPWACGLADIDPAWHAPRATFVTLESTGALRGCIGSILPRRPLAHDVVENAFAAAFRDTRFSPVTEQDCATLEISISVLGPLSPIPVQHEEDLLAQLVPNVDGLIIADGYRRSVFLPQVWQQLPKPKDFLVALKRKGGFSDDPSWPPGFSAQRFSVSEVPVRAMVELS